MNRRELLGTLAGVAVVWPTRAEARASASRVFPGAPVRLRCAGADGYLVEADGCAPYTVAAHGRCRAPRMVTDREWTVMRCTPLRGGRPVAAPVEVRVLTAAPSFGA